MLRYSAAIFFVACGLVAKANLSVETETACFDVVLQQTFSYYSGKDLGWNGAAYALVTGDGEVVANGTLESGFEKTDRVCVAAPACFVMSVTSGGYDSGLVWTLGDGAMSGSPPPRGSAEVQTGFYVSGYGDVTPASCSSRPTVSPAPTASAAPSSAPTQTRACFDLLLQEFAWTANAGSYSIHKQDGVVVARGKLEYPDTKRIDRICVVEAPACYTMRVTQFLYSSEDVSGFYWTMGDGTLTKNRGTLNGTAPFDGTFVVTDDGDILPGCTLSPTVSPAPTASPAPSSAPTQRRTCFDLLLRNLNMHHGWFWGWGSRTYSISRDDGLVVATGTLDHGFLQTDEVCVPKGKACYVIRVSTPNLGYFTRWLSWTLGGVLSGGDHPPALESTDFFLTEDGDILPGCTSSPTISPAPTTTVAPSYAACFDLVLQDSGRRYGAAYSIFAVDGVVVANGTLERADGFSRTDEVCVSEAPACYAVEVSMASEYDDDYYSYYRDFDASNDISWSLGGGALRSSAGAPFDYTDFFLSVHGDVSPGCSTPAPTVSPAPTTTVAPSHQPTSTRACFDLVLQTADEDDGTWKGATYSIFAVGGGVAVVADGTLDYGWYETGNICVPEAPACYAIEVSMVSEYADDWGNFRASDAISWSLGTGALSGGAPFEGIFFVSGDGDVSPGCNTSAPTVSPAPTASGAPSQQPTQTRACFDFVLQSTYEYGGGWDGATYSISTVDDEVVVANGTLTTGMSQTDRVCVPETPGCYAIKVTAGNSPGFVIWSTGDGRLSGGARYEGNFYVSSAAEVILPDCISSPTMSPAPTTTMAPSHEPTLTRACFDLLLQNPDRSGWAGAAYSISKVDGGVVVVASGTLDRSSLYQYDTICVEAPACYAIKILSDQSCAGRCSWSLANDVLYGSANDPFEGNFLVSADGSVIVGCNTSSPTISPAPTVAPLCFPFVIRDLSYATLANSYESNPVSYSIFSSADDGVVVTSGTLDYRDDVKAEEVCFTEAPACYTIRVGNHREGDSTIFWSLGTLSGGESFEGTFLVGVDGHLSAGCTTAFPTTQTPVPTSSSTRTFFETASCFDGKCTVLVNFDTAAFVDFVDSAALTVDLAGAFGESYDLVAAIDINGAYVGTCGKDFDAACVQSRCPDLDKRDVTAAARTGSLNLSFTTDSLLADAKCLYAGWPFAMKIEATLVMSSVEGTCFLLCFVGFVVIICSGRDAERNDISDTPFYDVVGAERDTCSLDEKGPRDLRGAPGFPP